MRHAPLLASLFLGSALAGLALFGALRAQESDAPVSATREPVDLLLVLAADVSRSLDHTKFQLQRNGYASAFTDKRVVNAATSGPHGRIAVTFVEWSGYDEQYVIVGWTLIANEDDARRFSDRIIESPRPFAGRTSISGSIDFAMVQLARAPYTAERRTIDVSGDGTHNNGRDVRAARDEALAQGVTINGLVILSEVPLERFPDHTHPPGGLANYYRENVIGGDGSFVMTADNFQSFGMAIINKLVAEIAENPAAGWLKFTAR
jgi:hypothetical protein